MRVLVVEDDRYLSEALGVGLEEMGYSVETAHDGREGEERALLGDYDLMIVDWEMPYQDGPSLVQRLRAGGVSTPILMLTAYADIAHRVSGLDAGADDYLTKPFSFEELYARCRALGRRKGAPPEEEVLVCGALTLSVRKRAAHIAGRPLELRPKEFSLLELLLSRRGSVVTRTIIAERVWGSCFITEDVINMTISNLRRALQKAAREAEGAPALRTLRGIGYTLDAEQAPSALAAC